MALAALVDEFLAPEADAVAEPVAEPEATTTEVAVLLAPVVVDVTREVDEATLLVEVAMVALTGTVAFNTVVLVMFRVTEPRRVVVGETGAEVVRVVSDRAMSVVVVTVDVVGGVAVRMTAVDPPSPRRLSKVVKVVETL